MAGSLGGLTETLAVTVALPGSEEFGPAFHGR
jgi:hypothetical protein